MKSKAFENLFFVLSRFLLLCAMIDVVLDSEKFHWKARLSAAMIALLVQKMKFPMRQVNVSFTEYFLKILIKFFEENI